MTYKHTFLDRFLRYVQIDTQSDPNSSTIPSTEKQKALGKLLVEELQEMGISDAHMDEYGYVYATIPSNTDKEVPVICFCSHMDTSPDSSGTGVKPIIHRNYDGSDLVLPDDPNVVIRLSEHPDLAEQIGNDIITASGTTLLGADNKAGLAEIMDAANYFMTHPEVKHGTIRILFTPDEEIGRGVDKVDMEKLGADFGYTVDGEKAGSLEDETFSADAAIIEIQGISAHPGFAKGKLVSALKIASEIVAKLPKDTLSPETTEGREGFVHPVSMDGTVENAKIVFIVRDFTDEKLQDHEAVLQKIMDEVLENYPGASGKLTVTEQYRNMKKVLDNHPQVVDYAVEAIKRAGLKPIRSSIRGGTDGSRLSFMGLPCPNIFAGEHAFHSKQEWVSVQDMEKATLTIIHLARIWEENS
ncbi:MAG: peptidase T [Saprospirales bacterium]|nr:peptidase T [Saprospirales bacterium]